MNNDSRRNYVPLLIVLTLGLYVLGQSLGRGGLTHYAAPQVVGVAPASAPLTARVRKYEFDNGNAIAEYDLGRFRCFELLSGSEVRFACAAH